VTNELLSYLNQPGVTANKLFQNFSDVAGSFTQPALYAQPTGEWLSWKIPSWQDKKTANKLAHLKPGSWIDILRVPRVGPDTLYDMWRLMLVRFVAGKGVSLPLILWQTPAGLKPIDLAFTFDNYFIIKKTGSSAKDYVKTSWGIPHRLDNNNVYVFPTAGSYVVWLAQPKAHGFDLAHSYQPSELEEVANVSTNVAVASGTIVTQVIVKTSRLVVECDARYAKLTVVTQKSSYWAWDSDAELYNKNGVCSSTTCKQFAFRKQEDLENPPLTSVTKPQGCTVVTFYGLPDVTCKVLGFSDKGIAVATVARIPVKSGVSQKLTLAHSFDAKEHRRIRPKAFLQGDIIRQSQRTTSNCRTFSIALAASYWDPLLYNPLERNGKWVEDNYGDWPTGTFQGSMNDAAKALGFNQPPAVLDPSTDRDGGLEVLKGYIDRGIPVIVNIDEWQDTSNTKGEHYKVLVGYDDNAVLHFTRKDGTVGSGTGALYFANSGAKGRDEGDPKVFIDDIPDRRR